MRPAILPLQHQRRQLSLVEEVVFRAALTRELSDLDTVALPAPPNGGRYDHPLAGVKA